MAWRKIQRSKASFEWSAPVVAAQKYIRLFEEVKHPNSEQRAMLAAAFYTLSTEKNISSNRCRLHLNATISLLKQITISERSPNWANQIARAYFKRAELLEEKAQFILAIQDYRHAMEVLELQEEEYLLQDEDRVLLAQAAISIADILVNEEIEISSLEEVTLLHPLFFINRALEHLEEISEVDEEIWVIHAYAHQIAAIALSIAHFEEAKEAFRISLLMAYKTEGNRICSLLADTYTCLGALYEEEYLRCPIQNTPDNLFQHSTLYFGLSLLFNPSEESEKENDTATIESLFEMIYRVLDPYLVPLSYQAMCDLIDALIYAYLCVLAKALPNQVLQVQLNEPHMLDTLAQHIYWLVVEAYRRQHSHLNMIEIIPPFEPNIEVDLDQIQALLENEPLNNVCYFPTITPSLQA